MNKHSHVTFAGPSFAARHVPTRREGFLADMERTVPWTRIHALVEPVYLDPKSRRMRPLELDRMLRIYFLQRWYRLTDAGVRDAIADSSAMRSFVCIGQVMDGVPQEGDIRKFRELLQEYGLGEVVVQAADRHLRAFGLAVAPGAIVDPTVISNTGAHGQAPFARVVDTAGFPAG
jgi:transposase, IS5 family